MLRFIKLMLKSLKINDLIDFDYKIIFCLTKLKKL